MNTISIFTGTRAEYGLLKHLIKSIDQEKGLELQLIVSGSHLSNVHGKTITEIEDDGIKPNIIIPLSLESRVERSMAYLTGEEIMGMDSALSKICPDLLIVLGDRYEAFAAASTAHLLNIPIAHLHGGETTLGAVDDRLRHAITQLSLWHFTAAEEYKKKVISMGIPESNVFQVGPMIIDGILNNRIISKKEFEAQTGYIFGEKNLLVTYHPETLSSDNGVEGFQHLLLAIRDSGCNVLFTNPNADNGGGVLLKELKEFVSSNKSKYWNIASLGQKRYLNALRLFDAMAGNSSSGIIEAPLVNMPVLNIGNRQAGRIRFGAVADASCNKKEISKKLNLLLASTDKDRSNEINLNSFDSPTDKILNWLRVQSRKGF